MKCRLAASLLLGSLLILTSCSNNSSTTTTGPSGTGFLWVAAQGNNTVSAFTLDLGTGVPTQNGSAIDGGLTPNAMVISPDGTTMFVVDKSVDGNGNYNVLSYTVNSTGTLTAGSTTPLTNVLNPVSLAIDPTGKILFVANQGALLPPPPPTPSCTLAAYAAYCGNISVFSVSGTTLTELAGSPFSDVDPNNPVVAGPSSLAVTPTGNYLYVANQFTNTVSAFQYDSTGVLTPLSPFTYTAGSNPTGLALSRNITVSGTITQPHFLYVANSGSDNITGFAVCDIVSVNCLTPTGQLTELSSSPYAAGHNPVYIAVNPIYNGVYAVDQGSNAISMYKWASDSGSLSVLTPATVSTGTAPTWAQVHPDGVWVYVANTGGTSVSIYSVGESSPLLGPIPSGPISVQPQPSALVLR
ncbi:MAG: beta-propeller fold lactonase family protein [Terriglobales bacterium]